MSTTSHIPHVNTHCLLHRYVALIIFVLLWIKNATGAMAKGRLIQPSDGAFELLEAQSAYTAIFDPENGDIGPKKD